MSEPPDLNSSKAAIRRAGGLPGIWPIATYAAAVASGLAGLALGTAWAGPVVFAHGVAGFAAAAALLRPKGSRSRRNRGALGAVLAVVVTGLLHSSGLWVGRGEYAALSVHLVLAAGLAVIGIAIGSWSELRDRQRSRRRGFITASPATPVPVEDSPRRRFLLVAGGALGARVLSEGAIGMAGLDGARRRFTGSYETGSFDPKRMPNTQWLNDRAPKLDVELWELAVSSTAGRRQWRYDELARFDDRFRATIDCTGAWYSTQDWEGVRIDRLLDLTRGRSIHVRSTTGYWRAFPRESAKNLLVALRVAGEPLSIGHGYPARLVAPGRRGFSWVKWIEEIAISDLPWWWQPPLPLR